MSDTQYKSIFNPHEDLAAYTAKETNFSKALQNVIQKMKEIIGDRKLIFLLDHDGALAHTNGLKDTHGGPFMEKALGKITANDRNITKSVFDTIHHGAHGMPMWQIFNTIAALYGCEGHGQKEGEELTQGLNDYIKDDYASQPAIYGIDLYLQILSQLGKCEIVTGMETDLVKESVLQHGWEGYIEGVYGSPNTKAENLELLKEKHGSDAGFFIMGDGGAEYALAQSENLPFTKVAVPDPRKSEKSLKFIPAKGHKDAARNAMEMLIIQLSDVFNVKEMQEFGETLIKEMEEAIKKDEIEASKRAVSIETEVSLKKHLGRAQ